MSYRRRDKPPFSAWLVAERTKRAWKAGEVARRLRELGYQAEESTYRTWEAGRRPSAETVAALERLFEAPAPGDAEPGSADVAGAIREQAASNDRLAEAMQAQAEAFTTLAASIDRASAGVTTAVGEFPAMLLTLLSAIEAPRPAAPAGELSGGPHAPVER